MRVPFPPKQVPRDIAHQIGSIRLGSVITVPICLIKGIIVATKGTLSIKAERTPESQSIAIEVGRA